MWNCLLLSGEAERRRGNTMECSAETRRQFPLLPRRRLGPLWRRGIVALVAVLCVAERVRLGECLKFSVELHGLEYKCFAEQVGNRVLLIAEFRAASPLNARISYNDRSDPIFEERGKSVIRTAFTTTRGGKHQYCVQNTANNRTLVHLNIVWGPEAKDYSKVAKAEHLSDMVVTLRKVEDQLKLYHNNILYLREWESRMRQTNDSTATKLIIFCFVNIFLLIGTAALQAYYFRNFFRSKKII